MGELKIESQGSTVLGHRQRLKDRFLKGGGDALADYEFLELILFLAQPRGDTKPLAKDLIAAYKNIAAVLSAPAEDLKKFKNLGDTSVVALKIIREAAIRMAKEQILDQPILSSWQLVLDYCKSMLAYDVIESFHILFLDNKNRLVGNEKHQEGTVDHAAIYPREVVKLALSYNASAIILVHNHPSGDPSPSRADIDLTKNVATILQPLDIRIHDHLIIGKSGHRSLKALGLI